MARLTQAQRDALMPSTFVFPARRAYPIPDRAHAMVAIKDATGTRDEAAVRRAVARKFGIGVKKT